MNFKDILIKRRAINFFDPDRDVEESLLKTVIENAANAPSSYNLQPWKLMVLRDHGRKTSLQALAFNQPKVTEAPVILIVLADRDGWKAGNSSFESVFKDNVDSGKMQQEHKDSFSGTTQTLYGQTSESSQAFANKNAGLFAMSLMYSATEQGLETHPMDGFDHDGVKKEFNIPDNYWIPMLIAVGYLKPGVKVHPKAWRQSYEEMILK
ncbi:Nitroreductase [Maridesulfovibrio ferrireducens]|uniref:Nitroreductase n=1 Tax=Maridesulfovibrio ferrireducens TaxID=246191 RepID=A0A1G9JA50_9BACT|nr:nitroreductase family protein [Maridesulfovibrio ferrireducens]SDL34241.1 Nitroreductase [Maridesulfovibrio ferrireducens]